MRGRRNMYLFCMVNDIKPGKQKTQNFLYLHLCETQIINGMMNVFLEFLTIFGSVCALGIMFESNAFIWQTCGKVCWWWREKKNQTCNRAFTKLNLLRTNRHKREKKIIRNIYNATDEKLFFPLDVLLAGLLRATGFVCTSFDFRFS